MPKIQNSRGSPRERGAITPILAAGLAMALGLMALTIDLGQLFVGKNELQNIADAAALAGAKKLIQAKDPANPGLAAVYCDEAISTAQAVASENRSFGETITVTGTDVTLGQWDLTTGSFTRTGCSADPLKVTAIQVTVRRDGTDNPQLTTFFGGLLGVPEMATSATAVAYLGLAGTSSLSIPFAVPINYPGGEAPYVRTLPGLDWLLPRPAIAADSRDYTWYDKGGSSLDTTRATFIMPTYSERTSLSNLQKYIKGPGMGGLHYPQVEVGRKVYPISEYRWASNVYNNFKYLRDRYNDEKDAGGKWRVTAAVYGTDDPLASLPTPHPWLKLAQRLLGPKAAHACASYTAPSVYVQGFVTLDITEVSCEYSCKYYSYPDERSCYNTCYVEMEVPLKDNFVTTDQGATSDPMGQDYHDMNPIAHKVGNFASVPYLVK